MNDDVDDPFDLEKFVTAYEATEEYLTEGKEEENGTEGKTRTTYGL